MRFHKHPVPKSVTQRDFDGVKRQLESVSAYGREKPKHVADYDTRRLKHGGGEESTTTTVTCRVLSQYAH